MCPIFLPGLSSCFPYKWMDAPFIFKAFSNPSGNPGPFFVPKIFFITTTFAIKLSIPLIALPVIAVVFFQLGRNYAIPFPFTTFTSTPSPAPIPTLKISKTGTFYIAKGKQTSYLLSLKDGGAVILEIPSAINVSKYINKQILVTGIYNSSTNILKVEDIAEIELFNSLSIPSDSIPQVPKTATPSATSSQ